MSGRYFNPIGYLRILGWVIGGVWALTAGVACHRMGMGRRKAHTVAFRPMCWVHSHRWAHEDRYGVEPVCLVCLKRIDSEAVES